MTDHPEVTLTLDGKRVHTPPGRTLLDVARAQGIAIPTLCHDPRLPAYGSCQLCVVEVEGAPRLMLSCATEAKDGMKVQTKSARVVEARRSVLGLLLSNHFADCLSPCSGRCPAGVDVQGYLSLAAAGKNAEALALVRARNPFPSVCGRVCVHYCEASCRRGAFDSPVAINFVKRYLADLAANELPAPVSVPENGKQVAVVGGGPAGITAGYYLRQRGFGVTLFEAQPKLGGMLRYGIPDYRLPQDVLDREIEALVRTGITVKTSTRLGKDVTLDLLKARGYDAILVALGAGRAKPMGVEAEATPGVVGGVDFLESVKKEGAPKLRGPVLVVGGGNTAIDAARTAMRCGASRVTILYRRTREEMPADPGEVEDALAEGVGIEYLVAPLAVVAAAGHVEALSCQEMRLGEPDSSGRRRPVAVPGSSKAFPANLIVAAIGQDVDLTGTTGARLGDLQASKWKTLAADPMTLATNIPGVFAAGDVVSGPAAAIDAIAAGHRAAEAIAGFLDTGKPVVVPKDFLSRKQALAEPTPEQFEGLVELPRVSMRKLEAEERVRSFEEVNLGIGHDEVVHEVERCLSCGCAAYHTCELRKYASEYQVEQTTFKGRFKKYRVDRRHPFIALDPNKCILCGRCVRLCGELIKSSALGFLYRGVETVVRPTMERPLLEAGCISCGNCIDVCPTGAVGFHRSFEVPGTLAAKEEVSICNYCGVGCALSFRKHDDELWSLSARRTPAGAPGDLCVKGRFGHRQLMHPARLRTPKVRDGEALVPATLARAIDEAASRLKAVVERDGAESVGVFVSPRATNEEIFLTHEIAHHGLGTTNVGSFFELGRRSDGEAVRRAVGFASSSLPVSELAEADLILAVNTDLTEANPVLAFEVQRALRRHAELISIAATPTRLGELAKERLPARRGTSTLLLRALASMLIERNAIDRDFIAARTEGFAALAAAPALDLADVAATTGVDVAAIERLACRMGDLSANVVIVYDDDDEREKAPDDLLAIIDLLLLTGRWGRHHNGLILTRRHANGQGWADLARATPGHELARHFEQGRLSGLLLVGEDPAADRGYARLIESAACVVAMDFATTETTRLAHVVLPGTLFSECHGSATTLDRRVQAFAPVFPPPAGVTGFDILSRLMSKLTGRGPLTLAQVRQAIADEHPGYVALPRLGAGESFYAHLSEAESPLLFATRFATANGKAQLLTPTSTPQVFAARTRTYSALEASFEHDIKRRLVRALSSPGYTA